MTFLKTYPAGYMKISCQIAEEKGKLSKLIEDLSNHKEKNILSAMHKNVIYRNVKLLYKILSYSNKKYQLKSIESKKRFYKLSTGDCRPENEIERKIINYISFHKSLYFKEKNFRITVDQIIDIIDKFKEKKESVKEYNEDKEIITRQSFIQILEKYEKRKKSIDFYYLDIIPEAFLLLDVIRFFKKKEIDIIFIFALFRLVLTAKDDMFNYVDVEEIIFSNFEKIENITKNLGEQSISYIEEIPEWFECLAEIVLKSQTKWKNLIFQNRDLKKQLIINIIKENIDKNEFFSLKYISKACHEVPADEILSVLKEIEKNKGIVSGKNLKKNTWKRIFKNDAFQERKIKRGDKAKIVENTILNMKSSFTFRDIQNKCPEISSITIRNILKKQKETGKIKCIPKGCNSKWCKTTDNS